MSEQPEGGVGTGPEPGAPPCQCGGGRRGIHYHYDDGRACLHIGLPAEDEGPSVVLLRPQGDAEERVAIATEIANAPQPILTRWLEGESLDDLDGDEHTLRVELAEMQTAVLEMQREAEKAIGQRNAYAENARKLHHLLAIVAENVEKESMCYGGWDADPERHGYMQGRGEALRIYQRTLEWLGNLVRVRAHYDGEAGKP